MFNNLSLEKAKKIQEKTEEIKAQLNEEIFTHSSEDGSVQITLSVAGTVKEIKYPEGSDVSVALPTLNEALVKAYHNYEVKRAQLLQSEIMKLM